VLFNLQLNLFHLLSILLIVGVGVDYSLFFNRTAKDRQEWEKNSHGVMVGASSTLVAFGVLIFSEIPVMVAIGQTVAIGVCACFILALLFAKKQNI
jgi:predicted exporter